MVRAKFRVTSINRVAGYGIPHEVSIVKLNAVGQKSNESWNKATPSGQLEMQINNPEALEQFKLGQHYFLDFTEAPEKESDEK